MEEGDEAEDDWWEEAKEVDLLKQLNITTIEDCHQLGLGHRHGGDQPPKVTDLKNAGLT